MTVLFGSQPMKRHDDYAKFEPDDLPLVLSLVPRRAPGTGGQGIAGKGVLNHLGFRMADAAALVDVQKRLELAGISTLREEGVECCYARQTKFWVRDPDDNVWEIYVLEGDIDHRGAGQPRLNVVERGTRDQQPSVAIACKSGWAPAVWAHRLDEDFPSRLEPNSLDEIFLQGTFNCQQFAPLTADVLRTACEGLRPGGKLIIHALTTDRALDAPPQLPGLASLVTHVPVDRDLLSAAQNAGLVGIELSKFGDGPCFHFQGLEIREMQLVAWKPEPVPAGATHVVMYKGPFVQASDETGRVFRRGERVHVDAATRRRLQQGAAAGQFAFLTESDAAPTAGCCG